MTNAHNSYSVGDGGGGTGNGQMGLRALLGVCLAGGTLVEYQEHCEFRKEYARATIVHSARMGEGLSVESWFGIQTTRFQYGLNLALCPEPHLYRIGDVYLWQHRYPASGSYAAAPVGVTIPGPEWVWPAWLRLHRELAVSRATGLLPTVRDAVLGGIL